MALRKVVMDLRWTISSCGGGSLGKLCVDGDAIRIDKATAHRAPRNYRSFQRLSLHSTHDLRKTHDSFNETTKCNIPEQPYSAPPAYSATTPSSRPFSHHYYHHRSHRLHSHCPSYPARGAHAPAPRSGDLYSARRSSEGYCHSHAGYVVAGSSVAEAGGAEDAIVAAAAVAAGLVAVVALVVVRLGLGLAPVAGLQVY